MARTTHGEPAGVAPRRGPALDRSFDPGVPLSGGAAGARSPLMVVLTHRPEFVSPWEGPRISRLPLGRLDRQHAEEILKSVAGEDALSGDVVDKLLTRADGVPLFLEEITKAVVEWSGLDSRSPGARGPAIPATLQDSLAARLDRLESGKSVAQLAATLGRTFEFELLKAVSGMEEDALRTELDRLMAAELLHRRGTPPKETYIFKHALIQDAAYASLLRRTRQQYHLKIVATLTEQFPETAEARPELLAHHYSGAGLSREAIDHWIVAGQRAMARSAFNEAIELFSQALKELPSLASPSERDKTEIELRSGLGLALISTRGWAVPEVEENYTRARRLCESFGSVPVQVLYGMWGVHLVRADMEAVTSVASMFRDLLGRTEDLRTRVAARSVLCAFNFYSGRYPDAARGFRGSSGAGPWLEGDVFLLPGRQPGLWPRRLPLLRALSDSLYSEHGLSRRGGGLVERGALLDRADAASVQDRDGPRLWRHAHARRPRRRADRHHCGTARATLGRARLLPLAGDRPLRERMGEGAQHRRPRGNLRARGGLGDASLPGSFRGLPLLRVLPGRGVPAAG